MRHAFENVLHHLQLGEELIVAGVDELFRCWERNSATVIGKLCTAPDRWRDALRQIQAPVDLADILRARAAR